MNDLDKRILELKGWEQRDYGAWFPKDPKAPGFIFDPDSPLWTGSDAKALELVDELLAAPGSRTPSFEMKYHAGGIEVWSAQFRLHYFENHQPLGSGNTRAAAICRAYIATREWMAGKGAPRVE